MQLASKRGLMSFAKSTGRFAGVGSFAAISAAVGVVCGGVEGWAGSFSSAAVLAVTAAKTRRYVHRLAVAIRLREMPCPGEQSASYIIRQRRPRVDPAGQVQTSNNTAPQGPVFRDLRCSGDARRETTGCSRR